MCLSGFNAAVNTINLCEDGARVLGDLVLRTLAFVDIAETEEATLPAHVFHQVSACLPCVCVTQRRCRTHPVSDTGCDVWQKLKASSVNVELAQVQGLINASGFILRCVVAPSDPLAQPIASLCPSSCSLTTLRCLLFF